MPSWKKILASGSAASFSSVTSDTYISASSFNGTFTGSLFGTSSQAISSSYAATASYALNAGGGLSSITIATGGTTQGTASYFNFTNGVSASFTSATASFFITTTPLGTSVTFTQSVAANTWSFSHGVGSRTPIVQAYDSNYDQIIPTRIYSPTPFQTNLYFDVPELGYAIISTGGTVTASGSNSILTQASAATTWSFYHNLGTQYPVFTIFDSSDNVIVPQKIYAQDTASALVYFSSPTAGKAVAALGGLTNNTASFALTAVSASYAATSSFGLNAISASYAFTASSASTAFSASYAQTSSFANNFTVANQLTAQTLIVSTISSSVVYSSGSNIFGNSTSNTQTMTGSLNVSGSATIIGRVTATDLTGSLFGTASQAVTASYALTASFVASIAGLSTSQIATGSVTASVGQSTASFQLVSGSTTLLYVSNSGFTGLGTNTPSSSLTIAGGNYTLNFGARSAQAQTSSIYQDTADGLNITFGGDLGKFFNIRSDNSIITRFRPSGVEITGLTAISNGLSETGSVNISGSVTVTGSITTNGTITAQTLVVQTVTSSIVYSSGSNIFGSQLTDRQTFTGSMFVTGSATIVGRVTATDITGSLFGTASQAITASYLLGGVSSLAFPYSGSAQITGSLGITGSLSINGSLLLGQNTSSLGISTQTVSTNATSSYTSVFYNYTLASGSNARAGQVIAVWSGSAIQYMDNSTTDIGNTSLVALTASLSSGNVLLTTVLPTAGWTVKTLVNLL